MNDHDLFEPPVCHCGHYIRIHRDGRCPGWSLRKVRLGPFLLTWRCRCRKPA